MFINKGRESMKKIFRYRKSAGLIMLISTFLLYFPPYPARAVMINTQYPIHQDAARTRVRAFLERTDVAAQMQAYGISPKEARSRVESLTDSEIASIAGKMDRFPAGSGGTYSLDGGLLMFIGMALYAIIAAIVIYFSFHQDKEEKPQ
jgi:hypothetical protein